MFVQCVYSICHINHVQQKCISGYRADARGASKTERLEQLSSCPKDLEGGGSQHFFAQFTLFTICQNAVVLLHTPPFPRLD